jgi:hypothetical protein
MKERVSGIVAAFIAMVIMLTIAQHVDAQKQSTKGLANTGMGLTYEDPAYLGMNAIVEPASLTTAQSNYINLVGARTMTVSSNCTQGPYTLNVQTFAEDGSTALGNYAIMSAIPAGAGVWHQVYIGTEIDLGKTSGTLGVLMRMPQNGATISFTNSVASAGTCTARVFLGY